MALISFPTVSLMSINCELIWPGQRVHESVYTGDIQTISRGIGRWSGTFVWPTLGRTDNADWIREIDAFFAMAEGAVNVFDIPWPAEQRQIDAIPRGTDVRLLSAARTGSTIEATLNHADGLLKGDRVTIDNKMFMLTTNLVNGVCTLSPHRALTVPTGGLAVNWQSPTVRARLTQSNPVSVTRNVDWAGPWSASFVDIF